jgi:hypothetical protein
MTFHSPSPKTDDRTSTRPVWIRALRLREVLFVTPAQIFRMPESPVSELSNCSGLCRLCRHKQLRRHFAISLDLSTGSQHGHYDFRLSRLGHFFHREHNTSRSYGAWDWSRSPAIPTLAERQCKKLEHSAEARRRPACEESGGKETRIEPSPPIRPLPCTEWRVLWQHRL